ncbi:MAG: hypothetical protein DHS20C13_07030 [Thermodesulfobacteriota bacterium]|nr:MAG: hypothetical protein DHS20C13_07030 [Thermodesulfobacteriota bacterium]
MGLNRDYIGREYTSSVSIGIDDIAAYSSAIGFKSIRSNDSNASPCFSVTYELPLIYKILEDSNLHGSQEQAKKNMLMLVHGDQQIKFYKPIVPGDKITCRARISDIEDKGSGEVIKFNMLSTNKDNDKVVESEWGLFLRGIGSGKRPESRKPKAQFPIDSSNIILRKTINIPEDITRTYSKASNDMNPIHLDEETAKRAGLPGIVVHGMCTMAMTAQGIIMDYLDSDSSNLLSMGVRFSAPVFPGDELEIEGWQIAEENKLAFHVLRKDDGVRVIRDGIVEQRV